MHFPISDDACKEPRPTPLYAACASYSVTNSWTAVNGFAAARVYSKAEDEYRAASEDAALVDLGPLCRYTLRGPDAASALARLTTTPVHELAVAESARGLILDADGAVANFADVTRLSGDLYLLTTASPADRRLDLAARGFDLALANVGAEVAALGIVGPAAREAAAAAGIDLLSADASAQGRVRGVELAVRPINFGAAPGVEIIYPAEDALVIWERLKRKRPLPVAGIDALEILRIEGGAPRLGVDFENADFAAAADKRRPDEIGLPHLAPPNRAWFNGRRAMKSAPDPERYLVVLTIDADAAPGGATVYYRNETVGRVTSAAFSPRLRRAFCFADIKASALDRPLEIGTAGHGPVGAGGRAGALLHDTAESRLAAAFRESLRGATDFQRSNV
jgi:aminomethyltransferase